MAKSKKIALYIIVLIISTFIININLQLDVQATSKVTKTTNKIVGAPTIQFNEDGAISGTIKDVESKKTVLNSILSEYRGIITFLSGIGTLSMIMFFILNFIELGNSKGNPQARQKAITGLIISAIATAGLGSVVMITTLFYNMLKL